MKDKGHGIVLDEKNQEQHKDKERAQAVQNTAPGHMPQQPVKPKAERDATDDSRK